MLVKIVAMYAHNSSRIRHITHLGLGLPVLGTDMAALFGAAAALEALGVFTQSGLG